MKQTLFDKVWDVHTVDSAQGGLQVLYIDKHFIHEVTSPQAFAELEERKLPLFRPEKIVATADHNVPTLNQRLPIKDELSRHQVNKLIENCERFHVELFGLGHPCQGIVHVIGPELGITQPGMTIVCGDSHTSTHGAFGAIAFGIGTSQVMQVMATQCLLLSKPKKMRISVNGKLSPGVSPKDVILYIISRLSSNGGTGYFVEYAGNVFREMSMEGRMTICNMSIEMGARGGIIAPDQITFDYIRDRQLAPKGAAFEKAVSYWETLKTDEGATFDQERHFKAEDIAPMITYGTNPGMGIALTERIPTEDKFSGNESFAHALKYMDFHPGEKLLGKQVNYVFIGSCTNSRIEDLRVVANIVKGRKKASHIHAFIVPGSKHVEQQAISEGLDKIFKEAGFELREPGCSACLGMNEDKIPPNEYCVSTSNRNFEGRQGPGARTLLASPMIAAITAIEGKITDIASYLNQ